ncbi:MAG: hypothetical protein ACKVOR_04055 [Flavobacteriales bacterium]
MEAKRENYLSMLVKVSTFHTDEAAAIATALPGHADLKVEFDEKLADMEATAAASELDISGFAAAKEARAKALIASTYKVGNACAIKLTVDGDEGDDSAMVNWNKSELDSMRDAELYMAGLNTWTIADPIKATLVPYGVTAADVDAMVGLRNQYRAIYQMPGKKIGKRAALLKRFDAQMEDMRDFLEKKLDQIFKGLLVSDPLLYDTYQNVRKIDDAGTGGNHTITGVVPSNTTASFEVPFAITGMDMLLKSMNTFVGAANPLQFYYAAVQDGPPRDGFTPISLTPGTSITRDMEQYDYDPMRPFFTVRNLDNSSTQTFKFTKEI